MTEQPNKGYGIKSRLASHLNVQSTYVSQILSGTVTLKEEHALAMADFLNLDPQESEYFLTMVSYERAGTTQLKNYYQSKLSDLQSMLNQLVRKEEGSVEVADNNSDYERFFSSWMYGAITLICTFKPITAQELSALTNLDIDVIESILDCLIEAGFIEKSGNDFIHTGKDLFLPKGHKLLNQHHINWRFKSIDKIQVPEDKNLHYTSLISCSKEDAEDFKNKIREMIKDLRKDIKESNNEVVCCYNIDFFDVF